MEASQKLSSSKSPCSLEPFGYPPFHYRLEHWQQKRTVAFSGCDASCSLCRIYVAHFWIRFYAFTAYETLLSGGCVGIVYGSNVRYVAFSVRVRCRRSRGIKWGYVGIVCDADAASSACIYDTMCCARRASLHLCVRCGTHGVQYTKFVFKYGVYAVFTMHLRSVFPREPRGWCWPRSGSTPC